MPDFLTFQLYAPLASWGDIATGKSRRSREHPSRSAVIGLVSASLGIRYEEEERHVKMGNSYGFAVCVVSCGEILRDYHTSQVPMGRGTYSTRKDELFKSHDRDKVATILSQRDYYMDSFYKAALWIKDSNFPFSLDQIKEGPRAT